MEKRNYLHEKIKHTNRIFPICEYMGIDKYPEQKDIVGSTVSITYRSKDIIDQQYLTSKATADRPKDDTPDDFDYRDSQEFEDKYNSTREFLVIRADNVEPYKMVAVSGSIVLVTDSRNYTDPKYNLYPGQEYSYIGYKGDVYFIERFDKDISIYTETIPEMNTIEDPNFGNAYIIKADTTHPEYCVIIQYLKDSDMYKVFLDDEVLFDLIERPVYISVNAITESERLIRNILEGKVPYGTN